MSLKALKEGLVALGVPVYRYHAPDNTSPEYIVWAEDGRDDFEADNRHSELVAEGTIDLYTHDENSALPRGIEQVLDQLGVKTGRISINDKGAVDCVIQARVETAIKRAGGEG